MQITMPPCFKLKSMSKYKIIVAAFIINQEAVTCQEQIQLKSNVEIYRTSD